MRKILLVLSNIKQIKETEKLVDGYIIPVKDLATNYLFYFQMKDILKLKQTTKKEIFISLNKNMHNCDIKFLKETLLKLDKLNVKGVLYYDVSILNLVQELNLKLNLVFSQEHAVVNSNIINFYYDEGVKSAYLSSELNQLEIKNIIKNTKSKLMLNIFGYTPIFTSIRPLVDNYLKSFGLKDKSKINYLLSNDKKYPIVRGENTTIFSANILNGLEEFLKLDVAYFVVNSFNLEEKKLLETLKIFKNINKNNLMEGNKKLNELFNNLDKAFLYKKATYKVTK